MTNSDRLSSYPPVFRPKQGVDFDQRPLEGSFESGVGSEDSDPKPDSDYASLPVIDFRTLNSEHLSQVCREWGMFRLTNHGVAAELLTQLHHHANTIFSESFESKQGLISNTPLLYFWGSPALTKSGNAQYTHDFNWLEGFNAALAKIPHFHYQDPLLESFRCLLEQYGEHQTRLAKVIFSTMAQDLNFPLKKKTSYLSPATGILRVYRYLRCPVAEERWGIPEHTDSSVLSIIHQDQVGGLQVFKNDKWLYVEPIQDTLIVNLGDMMQAMSDDEYVSVMHRVKVNRAKERVSIGYFVFPAEDAMIESSKYKPFTYSDFQADKELDLKTVRKKIGLPRYKKEQSSSDALA